MEEILSNEDWETGGRSHGSDQVEKRESRALLYYQKKNLALIKEQDNSETQKE